MLFRSRNDVPPAYRSRTNVTFRTPSPELDTRFWQEAEPQGFAGLKGHKLLGGIRASIYNAMPIAGVEALIDYMQTFAAKNA